MKNKLISLLLSIALKDINSIISFFRKLEVKLEEFASAKLAEIAQIEQEIVHLHSEKSALGADLALAQALKSNLSKLSA